MPNDVVTATGDAHAEAVLANARLVLPDEVVTGSVLIRGGVIAAIETGQSVPNGAIDCDGDYVSPGLIELHTDNLERHMQPRPGVAWPRPAAIIAHDAELASVGITSVFDALRVGSIISEARSRYGKYARETCTELLRLRADGALRISHFVHLRAELCSETLTEELDEFGPEDRIGIISVMDHTPGQRQFTDTRQLRVYLQGKYAMSDSDIDSHIAFNRQIGETNGPRHQEVAVTRAGELGAILASHDDTCESHVTESAAFGAKLAEFPTTLEAAAACRTNGIEVMMGAPNLLRGGSHSGNVAAATLAEEGLLDILSSDYAPSSLLSAAVKLGLQTGDMSAGIAHVTEAPARAANLDDRGVLKVGHRADLVRFATSAELPITRGVWVRGARVA